MPKVTAIVVVWNSKKYVERVFGSIANQTFKDIETIAVINADDGSKGLIQSKFPNVKIIDPGSNIGFGAANNLGIKQSTGEFIQMVNPDLILEPGYVEKILEAFDDPKVASATGKLLRYDFDKDARTNFIDSTGVIMEKSGRGRDRGQLEEDQKQYDDQRNIFGVSGAGPMHRRSALELIKYCEAGKCEYIDEDINTYWEDVDLSWRLSRAGFHAVYVPEAVGYHGRTASQSGGGYWHVLKFIRHHRKLSPLVRQLNYKNHILMYLKNAPYIHPMFIVREIGMFCYALVFEPSTLRVIPELFRLVPKILKKRNFQKKIS